MSQDTKGIEFLVMFLVLALVIWLCPVFQPTQASDVLTIEEPLVLEYPAEQQVGLGVLIPDDLARQSDVIVQGTVTNIESQWDEEQATIFTNVTISVARCLKGDLSENELVIKQPGGVVGDIALWVSGVPEFRLDEELIVCLKPSADGYFTIVGQSSGIFTTAGWPSTEIASENIIMTLLPRLLDPENIYEEKEPDDPPPYLHWDLREFPDCKVPWSISEFVPDINEDEDIDENDWGIVSGVIELAFQEWADVEPAVIEFRREGVTVTNRAIKWDGVNVIDWSTPEDAHGDDVQWIPVGQGDPLTTIITAGANGTLETIPGADDFVVSFPPNSPYIVSGLDGIANSTAAGDDVQVIPFGQGQPNSVVIGPGADGLLSTIPEEDDAVDGTVIRSGNDGIANTGANNTSCTCTDPETGPYLAATGIFWDMKTGRILESDITFNSDFKWQTMGEDPGNDTYEIWGTATHEIGHFIGLGHIGNETDPDATMNEWASGEDMRSLEDSDKALANFLYTPDLGDAPGNYPSLVHGAAGAGRTLNGVQLSAIGSGAAHLFGYNAAEWGNYLYEWLGPNVDGECEAKTAAGDTFDDGVRIVSGALSPGKILGIDIQISTSGNMNRELYLNGWIDWNGNGNWKDAGEKIIGTGSPTDTQSFTSSTTVPYEVPVPITVADQVWMRIRLDYKEDAGNNAQSWTDDTLRNSEDEGAAALGEVEDYLLKAPSTLEIYEIPGPVFPNVYIGIGAGLGAAVLAYFIRSRLNRRA